MPSLFVGRSLSKFPLSRVLLVSITHQFHCFLLLSFDYYALIVTCCFTGQVKPLCDLYIILKKKKTIVSNVIEYMLFKTRITEFKIKQGLDILKQF